MEDPKKRWHENRLISNLKEAEEHTSMTAVDVIVSELAYALAQIEKMQVEISRLKDCIREVKHGRHG